MSQSIVVFGFGAVGSATTRLLLARGDRVCVAQRRRPADLPVSAAFRSCDVLDQAAVRQAVEGADQVVLAVGFAYDRNIWRAAWPMAMTNVIEACAAARARLVFVDNLYMLGPQTEKLRENMALTDYGAKPAVRAAITRIWMQAAPRVRVAALRAPDFYGPGVTLSHLGTTGFAALARGKPALLVVPPDTPHDFAYVPDLARAVVSLLDAPDDVYGQAWNMPCAPTRTPREILRLGAAALGVDLRLRTIPLRWLPLLGLVSPMLREFVEMRFTWDRPYQVDASKFARRFWSDVTPFEVGAAATARSFRAALTPATAAPASPSSAESPG